MNEITKYEGKNLQPPPNASKPALTKHQRATLYFKAVRMIHTLLSEIGFQDAILPSHTAWSMDFHGFNLEVVVSECPRMARVTSYPGYQYDPEKITAKVENIMPVEPGEYVIRITGVEETGWSTVPLFVVVRKDSDDPVREAFVSVLHSIHDMLRTRPNIMAKIKEAMRHRDVQKEFDRLNVENAVGQTWTGATKAVGGSSDHSGQRSIGSGNDKTITI